MPNVSEGWLRAWTAPTSGAQDHTQDTKDQFWSFTRGAEQHEFVVLSGGGYTALTVPHSARGMTVVFAATATQLIYKGASGDTGILIDGATGMPLNVSLRGKSSTPGFQNQGANETAQVYWW